MAAREDVDYRFEVDDGVEWVDLSSIRSRSRRVAAGSCAFEVTYLDTRRLRLARAAITVALTKGPGECLWTLAMPAVGGQPRSWSVPCDGDAATGAVPAVLSDRVSAWARGRKLRPVVTLDTYRTGHRLVNREGRTVVNGGDDMIAARDTRPRSAGARACWREWFLHVSGPRPVQAAAIALVERAGARPADELSALRHLLGVSARPAVPIRHQVGADSTAGEVIVAHVRGQVFALLSHDFAARHDAPDGVHKMRVATRRLRSALSTFGPLFEHRAIAPLRVELGWLAGILGAARDAQVLRDRVVAELAGETRGSAAGSAAWVESALRADHRAAHHRVIWKLGGHRYFALLDRLDAVVDDPPVTALADGRADEVLLRQVRRAYRRVGELVSRGPTDRSKPDPWFHEIRKAAKRLRYAAEAVEPSFGAPAAALAGAAEHLQDILGEHQDSVVARHALRSIGTRLPDHGDTDTLDRLRAGELTRAADTAETFADAWNVLSDSKHRAWLRSAGDR